MSGRSGDFARNSSPSHLGDSSRISVSSPYPLMDSSQQHSRVMMQSSPSRSVLSASEYSLGGDYPPPSLTSSRNLNDDLVANKKMERENFEMKMKIFHLEEKLQRYEGDGMDGNGSNSNEINELTADNMSLRIRLEEAQIELEQRNTLLIKAKSAIETLKQEMDRLQLEAQRSHKQETDLRKQLEEAIRNKSLSPNTNNFHLSDEYLDTSISSSSRRHSQQQEQIHVEALQQQLKMSREATNAKDDALVACQEELAETKLSLDHYGAVNAELQKETNRLTERLRDYTRRTEELDKEIVASRTSVDFNTLQMNEKDHYIERLQDVIEKYEQEKKEYYSEKDNLTQAEQANLDSLRNIHEQEIYNLQSAMKSQEETLKGEIERLTEMHSQELTNERTRHEQESKMAIEKIISEHTTLIHQLKSEDAGESYRLREGLNEKIFEKEAEILRLKGIIELEQARIETQNNVNEELKKQLASQTNHLEGTSMEKVDFQKKYEAVATTLEKTAADGKQFQLVIDSLNLELQHERGALDTLRQEFRKCQSTIASYESQVSLYKSEINTLQQLSGKVEDTSRENERLKNFLQACKEDLVDMTKERDQSRMTEKIIKEEGLKKDDLILAAKDEVERLNAKIDKISGELRQSEQDLKNEATNVVRLQAIITEQRESSANCKNELDALRSDLSISAQKISTENFNSQATRAGFERSCSLLLQALMKWDFLLVSTIEGDDLQKQNVHMLQDNINKTVGEILKNPDELLHNSISVVERIQYKIDRVLKIRELFGKSSKTLVSDVERKFDAAQDKVSLMTYRLKALEDKSKYISHEIEKDAQRKESNSQEMKSFQHTIVSEHVADLKEAEERASNLSAQLQSEMHRSEALEHDVLLLKEEISALQSERYEIGQTENAVSALTEKFQKMAESNRLMSLEIEERGQTINKGKDQIQALTSEKNALLAGVQRLTSQIEMRDTIMTSHESNVAALKAEILQLKSRQINPALEKSILESQDVLKSSISNFSQHTAMHSGREFEKEYRHEDGMTDSNVNESALTSAFLSDNAVFSAIQAMFEKLSHFVSSVSDLSKGSEIMLRKYESLQVTAEKHDSSSIADDIFELLDANSRLSSKLLQLAIDFKRLSRKVLLQSSDESDKYEGVYFDSSRKNGKHGATGIGGDYGNSSESKGEAQSPRTSLSLEGYPFDKQFQLRENTDVMDSNTDSGRDGALGIDALSGSYDSPLRTSDRALTPVRSQQRQIMTTYLDGTDSRRDRIGSSSSYGSSNRNSSSTRMYSQPPSPSPLSRSSLSSSLHTSGQQQNSSQYPQNIRNPPSSVKFSDSQSKLLAYDSTQGYRMSQNSSMYRGGSPGSHHRQHQGQQNMQGGGSFQHSHSSQLSSSSRVAKLASNLQTLASKMDSFNSNTENTSKMLWN